MCSADKFPSILEFVELSVSKIMLKTGKLMWNVGHGKKKTSERRGFYVHGFSKGDPRKYFVIDSVFEIHFHLK